MKRSDIITTLEELRDARATWGKARVDFLSGYEAVLSRLLFEAAANLMSPQDVARHLGTPVSTVRKAMRARGLDGRNKTLMSKQAAEALADNAALLGIDPTEMDLMSPLAYLPMGEQMKRALQDKAVSKVTEVDDGVSGNVAHHIDQMRRRGGTRFTVDGQMYEVRARIDRFDGDTFCIALDDLALLLRADS